MQFCGPSFAWHSVRAPVMAGAAPLVVATAARVGRRAASSPSSKSLFSSRQGLPSLSLRAARIGAPSPSRARFETSASVPADPTTADLEAIEAAVEVI